VQRSQNKGKASFLTLTSRLDSLRWFGKEIKKKKERKKKRKNEKK
jgi:hypothetical protein